MDKWSLEKLGEAFDKLYTVKPFSYNAEREEKWLAILAKAGWTDEEFLKELESRIKYIPPTGYRLLEQGEKVQEGDIAYTWANSECTYQGWITVEQFDSGELYDPDKVVPIARKIS